MRFDHDLDRVLSDVARSYNVDSNLLRAITLVESSACRWAVRYEDHFKHLVSPETYALELGISVPTEIMLQKTSWGPMQIMGAVARENGFADHLTKLTDANLAYQVSVKHLKRLFMRFGTDERDIVAAWNWGHPRIGADGKYANQKYVTAVIGHLSSLRA